MPAQDTLVPPRPYARLFDVSLGDVRRRFSPTVYDRSVARALAWWVVDLGIYAGLLTAVFLVDNPFLKLGLGVLTGLSVACCFVWAHDAAHGTLFAGKDSRLAEVLGTTLMLPSMNMYRLWQFGHNRVHHGFTSLSTIDWIWRPLTPAEYAALSPWRRFLYRRQRSLPTCGLHYLVEVWWKGMVRFAPEPGTRGRRGLLASKAITGLFALGLSVAAAVFGGGLMGVAAAVVVPFLVFTYVIALVVYLHHTHPERPFFNARDEWRASIAQVHCSTVIHLSPLSDALLHHIFVHVPHHVDMRIPFYRLPRAWDDLRPEYGDLVKEYRFRWSTVAGIFARCKLFDFDEQRWYTFGDAAAVGAPPAS